MKRKWGRFVAGMLTGIMTMSVPCQNMPGSIVVQAESECNSGAAWVNVKKKLEAYGGIWDEPDYEGAVTDMIPQTALQGNGDVGVTSYGNEKEKTYLISKGDFINGGDLVTSAPFEENDRSIRQIALGGLTIKKDNKNKSLTLEPGVTVRASSVHDAFAPELAVNGVLSAQEEAWASKAWEEPHWFEIDLGQEKTIAKYVMYHMGAAREDLQHYNTREYKVSVSLDGQEWTEVDYVRDNAASVTSCVFEKPVQARYVRIDFIQGEQNSNERARIAEFEIFADASDESVFDEEEPVNQSLTQEGDVTVEVSSYHDNFVPEHAINGAISDSEEGWVSAQGAEEQWLKIDLGKVRNFQKYIMYHIGMARSDLKHFNTKAYTVSVSQDDVSYQEVDVVTENSEDYTEKVFDQPIQARYIKITFQEAEQTGEASGQRARIAEFEIFESPYDDSVFLPYESFQEQQDIAEADLTTNMKIGNVPVVINNWMAATENAMITAITSKGDKEVAVDASAWTKANGSVNFPTESGVSDSGVWASRSTYNAAKDNPESWTSKAVIHTKLLGDKEYSAKKNSDASSSLKFALEPGETVYLVTTVGGSGQTYNYLDELQGQEPLAEAEELAENYSALQDVEALRQDHEKWWEEYWMKSLIDIGDEEYHRYYYGSLYYMGCTVRNDTQAPGLYGIWVTTDMAKWNNDYHLNYNYMAPFYGMYSSNRMNVIDSVTQPILDYMPKAEQAAKEKLYEVNWDYVSSREDLADGIDGAVVYPVGLSAWGQASWEVNTSEKYLSQTLNAPFAASIFISYYNYSMDEEFLVEKAYPFVEKVAKFYEKWCEKEEKPDGTYQYNLYDGAHEGFFDKNTGVTIGMALNVYEFLIQNFDILQEKAGATQEQLQTWKDMYEHMAPIPVRYYEHGDFHGNVFALSEDGMIIRPESATVELEFIHPGERLSFDSDPEMLQVARNTIDAKNAANWDHWSSPNNTPKVFTKAIRVGYDPAYIMEKFRTYNLANMNKNFTISDWNHGIEKAGGIEFINNMLLQSSNGIIKVFPNWTGEDAKFYQLREKGAYLVSSELSQGEVSYIDVVSEAGKDVTIVCPWEFARVTDREGNPVKISYGTTENTQEKTITFEAEKGETYRIIKSQEEFPEYADLTGLEEAILQAEKIDRTLYTKASLSILDQAVEAGKKLLEEKPFAEGQEKVDEAVEKILDAIENLDALTKEEPVIQYANTDALAAAIRQAEAIQRTDYTEDSLAALDKIKETAKNLIASKPRKELQQTVDSVTNSLKKALENLVKVQVPPAKNTRHTVGSLIYRVTKSSERAGTVSVAGVAKKNASRVTVPSSVRIDGYKFRVTEIGKNAFKGNKKLKTVSIGNSVTVIREGAFANCQRLAKVTMGKNVRSIRKRAFYKDKKLASVIIKSGRLKKASTQAFKGISSKAVFKVPKKKMNAYKKILRRSGLGEKVKIKK